MFVYYTKETQDDGTILLVPTSIDLTEFNMTINNSGHIRLTKRQVKVDVLDPGSKVSFKGSSVQSCTMNDKPLTTLYFNHILRTVYHEIDDGVKIITNTRLNICTVDRSDKGFQFIPELGISVQGVNSDSCIQEIICQCRKNNISIHMEVKLADDSIVLVSS